jgi:hypothetical protein
MSGTGEFSPNASYRGCFGILSKKFVKVSGVADVSSD